MYNQTRLMLATQWKAVNDSEVIVYLLCRVPLTIFTSIARSMG